VGFTESHGRKKNDVFEQALLFFMTARRERPDEALVPARIGRHCGSWGLRARL